MGRFKTIEERTAKNLKNHPSKMPTTETVSSSGPSKELTPEEKELQKKFSLEERNRVLTMIFTNKEIMTAEYKQLIKHTGSLVAGSMAIAYSRAINDIIKLILKESNNEKTNQ